MNKRYIYFVTSLIGMLNMLPAHSQQLTADQVIDTMEKLNKVVPGSRRNHILGVCTSGHFVGNREVQAFSKSELFSGKQLPALIRFSIAGGNPNAPDNARSPRGMAIEFSLSNDSFHHFTMLNVPVFGAATPEAFHQAMQANMPDPETGKPNTQAIALFKTQHPESQALANYLQKNNPPSSYANSRYFSIHAFKFINTSNKTTLVKWRFEPAAGVLPLSDAEMAKPMPRFLNEELGQKIKLAPLKWKMQLVIGQEGDEQTNPTVSWPAERQEIEAGELTITTIYASNHSPCEKINFDPLTLSVGVEPTQDPVLLFRSPAYAASYVKRITGR